MSDLGDRLRTNKPLEKDEREWTLEGLDGLGELEGYRGPRLEAGEELPVVPKARLQQVEVEAERVSQALMREEARADVGWERAGKSKAELSIAREALEDALEGLRDMIAYVPEQFQEKWEHPGYIERAEAVLVRLQAKESSVVKVEDHLIDPQAHGQPDHTPSAGCPECLQGLQAKEEGT